MQSQSTLNPLLSPPEGLIFLKQFWGAGGGGGGEGEGFIERGGAYLAKRITGSKNTVVRDRVDFRVVVTVNSIVGISTWN